MKLEKLTPDSSHSSGEWEIDMQMNIETSDADGS